jgi:hypothetical protein
LWLIKGGLLKVTAISYGQFLINSPVNFTGTYFADSVEGLDHNSVYRYLKSSKLNSKIIWEKTSKNIVYSENGYLIFDDTVADKNFSYDIELVRYQYSGNEHGIIKGIGLVNCLYFNPELNRFWILDYRIFAPDKDGKSKLDHVKDMLVKVAERKIPFRTVLMDSWYATTELMLLISQTYLKIYYCPIKSNRLVDDSGGKKDYVPVIKLTWSDTELKEGKLVKIKKFPKDYKHKLFRVPVSTDRTDWIVTNDLTQKVTSDTRKECAIRWHIEEFHRELKQLTGVEKCQTRLGRSQRNHINLSLQAWIVLKEAAFQKGVTIYQQKHEPLKKYMVELWRNPATIFA